MTDGGARTACVRTCLAAAEVMAVEDDELVTVEHLLLAAAFHNDADSRARLVMKELGAHHFFNDDTYEHVAWAFAEPPRPTAEWTTEAKDALGRLAHWATRTGDHAADTAHLLLACLEKQPAALREAGVTPRDIVRSAINVRHRVSPADRQPRDRGPILSARRRDRPPSYQFVVQGKAKTGPSKLRHFSLRTQSANTSAMVANVQFHLTQLQVATLMVMNVVVTLMLIAIALAAFTVSWWALIWLAGQTRRAVLPMWVRLAVDVALVVVSVSLGLPWWLPVLAVVYRALDVLEGRLALLELRAETAQPALSQKDVRSDRRVHDRAAGFFMELKLRRDLSTR